MNRWIASLAAALLLAADGGAADLGSIPRTLAREPNYSTRDPQYCLLVFGPAARTRVWLVRDGQALYIDRNGNGDLTEAGEKVKPDTVLIDDLDEFISWDAGEITAADPEAKGYRIGVTRTMGGMQLRAIGEGKRRFEASDDLAGTLRFGGNPASAPAVHFGGKLVLMPDEPYTFEHGPQPTRFYVFLATPGLGAGSTAVTTYEGVPRDVHPVAEITFPAEKEGKPPLKTRVVLDSRC